MPLVNTAFGRNVSGYENFREILIIITNLEMAARVTKLNMHNQRIFPLSVMFELKTQI